MFFKCKHKGCNSIFKKSCNLRDHFRKHTGQRPFECPKCAKTFTQSGNLGRHMKNVHNMPRNELPPEILSPKITIRTQHKISKKLRPTNHENAVSTTRSEEGSASKEYDMDLKLVAPPILGNQGVQGPSARKNDLIVINLSPTTALSQDQSNEQEQLSTQTAKKLQEFGEAFQDMKMAFCPTRSSTQSFVNYQPAPGQFQAHIQPALVSFGQQVATSMETK